MVNSSQIKLALRAHEEEFSDRMPAARRAERARRICLLREKINDTRYMENALEKLASDLARVLY